MYEHGEIGSASDVAETEEISESSEDTSEIDDEISSQYNEYLESDKAQEFEYKSAEEKDVDELEESSPINESLESYEATIDYHSCPVAKEGYGKWDDNGQGERGESKWIPDRDYINTDPKSNPESLTNGQIMDKHHIDGINYREGNPDFSDVRVGSTVEIESFSDKRPQNFAKADIAYGNANDMSPEDVATMRKEQKLTWHEHIDCKTMELVPSEIHNNKSMASHRGGISKMKENSDG